jgi:HEAT repeat protein
LVEQAIPKLVDLLTDSDNKVRLAAVAAVGDIADTELNTLPKIFNKTNY